jgi:hypothetical protein
MIGSIDELSVVFLEQHHLQECSGQCMCSASDFGIQEDLELQRFVVTPQSHLTGSLPHCSPGKHGIQLAKSSACRIEMAFLKLCRAS